jgi:hypothetical protein
MPLELEVLITSRAISVHWLFNHDGLVDFPEITTLQNEGALCQMLGVSCIAFAVNIDALTTQKQQYPQESFSQDDLHRIRRHDRAQTKVLCCWWRWSTGGPFDSNRLPKRRICSFL